MLAPFNFLIDTGASVSALSAFDLGEDIDYTSFKKSEPEAFGVGGSQEFFLIHDAQLFFLTEEREWMSATNLEALRILPPLINPVTNKQYAIPSILRLDVIGKNFALHYDNEEVYLEPI